MCRALKSVFFICRGAGAQGSQGFYNYPNLVCLVSEFMYLCNGSCMPLQLHDMCQNTQWTSGMHTNWSKQHHMEDFQVYVNISIISEIIIQVCSYYHSIYYVTNPHLCTNHPRPGQSHNLTHTFTALLMIECISIHVLHVLATQLVIQCNLNAIIIVQVQAMTLI